MYDAIEKGKHVCYLEKDTYLPMIHGQDLIQGTIDLISAPVENLSRPSYNISAFNCSPSTLHTELKKYLPDLQIEYQPDFRQEIASSWPNSIDYQAAKNDWGFNPKYGFEESVLETLKDVYQLCREEGTNKCILHNTETVDNLELNTEKI